MHMCVVTACAHVLWPRPDTYCIYYVRAKFKPGGVPGCYDAGGNTVHSNNGGVLECLKVYLHTVARDISAFVMYSVFELWSTCIIPSYKV